MWTIWGFQCYRDVYGVSKFIRFVDLSITQFLIKLGSVHIETNVSEKNQKILKFYFKISLKYFADLSKFWNTL